MRLAPIEVRFSAETPNFIQSHRKARGVKGLGLRYEKKAHEYVTSVCSGSSRALEYVDSPWFTYRLQSSPTVWNWAQPDGLVIAPNEGIVYLVEIKLRHISDSYFQLMDRYLPLMERFFGPLWKFSLVELCKWYDPDLAYPCRVTLRDQLLDAKPNELSVHRWKDEWARS